MPVDQRAGGAPSSGGTASGQLIGGLTREEYGYYDDGAWYDAEYAPVVSDIPYYATIAAAAKGPLLELACGTGRLTIPMAQAGADVLGIDLHPAMVARAEEKRSRALATVQARLRFEVGDMRTLRLDWKFHTVVLGFNTIMHMTQDEDLEALLETVRLHLEPVRGRFHFDLHTPHPSMLLKGDPDQRLEPQEVAHPTSGQRFIVSENNGYDPRTQVNRMRFYYQGLDAEGLPAGDERCVELRLRVLFPRELERWLGLAGFAIDEEWDDYQMSVPFSGEGPRRIISARLR